APRAELEFPCIVPPKYDGIRFVVKDGMLLSRKLEPIPNLALSAAMSDPILNGFDGEFIAGDPTDKDVYHDTESVVMSFHKPIDDVVAYVFDDFTTPTAEYVERYRAVAARVDELGVAVIQRVPAAWIEDEVALLAAEDKLVRAG